MNSLPAIALTIQGLCSMATKCKLAIFDMDGVLVNSADIHTEALRKSIASLVSTEASQERFLDAHDGIRTKDKLKRLAASYDLSDSKVRAIDELKERLTVKGLEQLPINVMLVETMTELKRKGIKLSVGSNSRRAYVNIIVKAIGIEHLLDYSVSGDEVDNPKPHPEVFKRSMEHLGYSADETVIFEDSTIGIEAAARTGSIVIVVDSSSGVTKEQLLFCVNR